MRIIITRNNALLCGNNHLASQIIGNTAQKLLHSHINHRSTEKHDAKRLN